jgi:hypothetical protein
VNNAAKIERLIEACQELSETRLMALCVPRNGGKSETGNAFAKWAEALAALNGDGE